MSKKVEFACLFPGKRGQGTIMVPVISGKGRR